MQRQGARGRRLSFFTNGIHQGSKGTVHSCYFWNQFFQCQILKLETKTVGPTNEKKPPTDVRHPVEAKKSFNINHINHQSV